VNKSRVYDGYYRNPEATETKVVFDVLQIGDLYFRTGDIVTIRWNGLRKFITFEDRIGDTFRWKGENVSTLVS
jgi:acyl-CoA synthetase (AMP-forming)/AMP-acid ligase II